MLLRLAEYGILSLGNPISLASDPAGRVNWRWRCVFRRGLSEGLRVISNLISRRSPSAVASATAGRRIAPTPTRLKTSQTYYHRNQQYSIVGLTNAAGTLVERYTYSAYGSLGIYAANGTVRSSSTYANRYTYTGREWDADLRLYHFRARWYDPATGGFVSRDPLRYVDGMSLYRGYIQTSRTDPSGTLLIANDDLWWRFDRTRIVNSSDGVADRYVYTPQQQQQVEDKSANNGWCFCATKAFVKSHSIKTADWVGYELKWTIEGNWEKDPSYSRAELPSFRYFEWWDHQIGMHKWHPDNGQGRYEGLAGETWHEFPVVASDSFFNGQANDSRDAESGNRNPENTGLTPCAIYDHCRGNYAIDKNTDKPANVPSALTFIDHPGIDLRGANGTRGWSMKGRFMLVINNTCPSCKLKQLIVRASIDAWNGNFYGGQRGGDGFNGSETDGPSWRPPNLQLLR